jgi:hypothetical protein
MRGRTRTIFLRSAEEGRLIARMRLEWAGGKEEDGGRALGSENGAKDEHEHEAEDEDDFFKVGGGRSFE